MSVGVSAMDRATLRGVAFWTAVITSLIGLMIRAMYALIPFATFGLDLSSVYKLMGVVSLFVEGLSSGSLLLFLGLVHYDLMTAQRLSEHARDYLIRDLTQSSQENKSNHG